MKSKKKQRLLALILSMVLMLSASISAMAEGEVPAEASGTETTENQAAAQSLGEEAVPETEVTTEENGIAAQAAELTEEPVQEETEQEITEVPAENTETPAETTEPVQEETGEPAETTETDQTIVQSTEAQEDPAVAEETQVEEQPAETTEETVTEETVVSEAAELKQEFTDENGNVTQTVTAYVPEGAFQATADQISMEVSLLDTDDTNYIKGMMEELLPENYYLDGYVLYQIDFKVNDEITQPAKAVTITMNGNDLAVEDTQKAHVFYYDSEDPEVEGDKDQLIEVTQKDQLIKSLEEAGQSTENIEDYNYSEIAVNEGNADTITVKGWESTIYGCYVEKEAATELTYEDDSVTVTVSADQAGIIPEGAELSVTPITKTEITEEMTKEEKAKAKEVNAQYDLTEKKLNEDSEENEETMEGFLAYDISFLVDGEKIEPSGDVKVVMDFKEAAVPENVSEDAVVTVKHLKEDEKAEDGLIVEDMTEKAEVQTTDKGEVEKAELTTDSFSIFTVTWYQTKDGTDYPVQVTSHYGYLDSNGGFMEFKDESYTGPKLPDNWQDGMNNNYQGGDYVLSEYAGDVTENDINYYFAQGYVVSGKDAAFSTEAPARSISINKDNGGRYYFYRGLNNGGWEKVGASLSQAETTHIHVYFVYDKGLTTVDTLDNNEHGITMTMTNLENNDQTGLLGTAGPTVTVDGTTYYNVEQGILNRTLDENGYPTLSGYKWNGKRNEGASLETLFTKADTTTPVNHLFLSSTYENTGYYEYSSFANYAYLNPENNFIVYDALGTPKKNDKQFFYQRGNFLPYNNIVRDKYSDLKNLYDEDGERLTEEDPNYNAPLYLAGAGKAVDYHFAMTLNVQFYQPKDGLAEFGGRSDDMIYEFNGDDDLWVFIDDVLVLDIGGIHDAHSGYINFHTGEVYIELGMNSDGTVIDPYRSTIKELFQQAGKFPDGSDWDKNATDDEIAKHFTGNTFSDYSRHTMKIFYMERGEGASNLHIRFNLQTTPDGTVEVAKELSNTDKENYANEDFQFELYVQKKVDNWDPDYPQYLENQYEQVTRDNIDRLDMAASMKQGGTAVGIPLRWSDDGMKFLLKPDQSVVFSGLKADQKYYVKEVGVENVEYDQVQINTVTVTNKDEHGNIIGSDLVEVNNGIINISSTKDTVYDRPIVTFTNNCSAANSKELRITKKMEDGQSTNDTFTFQIQLESSTSGEEVSWVYYIGNYYLTDEDGNYYYYDNGKLTSNGTTSTVCGTTDEKGQVSGVPVDYTVSITGLLSGTAFKIVEIDPNTGPTTKVYNAPTYQIADGSADDPNTTNEASGTIKLGQDALVTVTNSLKMQISVNKEWIGTSPAEGAEVYVGLYKDAQPFENKTLLLNQSNNWSGVFKGLDGSGYTVKELRPVKDEETAEFNIAEKDMGYIGIDDGDSITVSDIQYIVDYGELTQDSTIKNQQNAIIKNVQKWQIVKRSSSTGNPLLSGAVFTLTGPSNAGENAITLTGTSSEDTGIIEWNKDIGVLTDGTYTLTETKAPTGYSLGASWTIEIENGIPTKISSNDNDTIGEGIGTDTTVGDGEVKFWNEKGILTLYYDDTPLYSLPSAGGPGIFLYMIGGTLLLITGSLMIYISRRKGVLRR